MSTSRPFRSRRPRAVAGAIALTLTAVLAACSSSGSAGPAPVTGTPAPSASATAAAGASWVSGANGNFPPEVNAWGAWRGNAADLAIVFTERANWSTIVTPEWPLDAFTHSKFPGKLSIAVPLFAPSGNYAACARGDYDHYWKLFGASLNRYGRSDAYVRLGWEFNGDWFYWGAQNAALFKSCFQHSVTAIRSVDPKVNIDWNISAHRNNLSGSGEALYAAYPGDAYVDVIGVDAYDSYPPSNTAKIWNRQCNEPSGLCTAIAFARAHHKKFSVPEWGLVRSTGGGGDNPYFITKMYDTFKANADILAYESYFNISEKGNVDSALHNPDLNPKSAAVYQRLFAAG